jgi:hypothetical protein
LPPAVRAEEYAPDERSSGGVTTRFKENELYTFFLVPDHLIHSVEADTIQMGALNVRRRT